MNGALQLLLYADDVNLLSESICIIQENAEALLCDNEEIGIVLNGFGV